MAGSVKFKVGGAGTGGMFAGSDLGILFQGPIAPGGDAAGAQPPGFLDRAAYGLSKMMMGPEADDQLEAIRAARKAKWDSKKLDAALAESGYPRWMIESALRGYQGRGG